MMVYHISLFILHWAHGLLQSVVYSIISSITSRPLTDVIGYRNLFGRGSQSLFIL